jgi:hypothetical protein
VDLDDLHDQAYTGGLEASHRFGEDRWSADLRMVGSWIHGDAESIDATQRSSVHYFQRPDEHVEYDPTRTSLAGAALLWSIGKVAGGHWRFLLGGDTRTAGLETNDLGYQVDSDYVYHWLKTSYHEDEPGRVLRSYEVDLHAYHVADTTLDTLHSGAVGAVSLVFANLWGAAMNVNVDTNDQEWRTLRGGPLLRRDPKFNVSLSGQSDPRRAVNGTAEAWIYLEPAASTRRFGTSASLSLQAMSNLDLSIGPSVVVNLTDTQYVDQVGDTMGAPHYILARIDQVTTALTLRVGYTWSPTLSFQLYCAPFLSAGRYGSYKDVNAPRADDYDDRYHVFSPAEYTDSGGVRSIDEDRDGVTDYSFGLADFNVRELRSNLIVRWEYRPGSTLFLIWSHQRSSTADDGRFRPSDDLDALAREPGEHVLLAKLTWWLGL